MGADWSIATYAELCAYHGVYTELAKTCEFNARVLESIARKMKKREGAEIFGKTIH